MPECGWAPAFTFNVLHTERNYIDLLWATLQLFLRWWMANGMWDYIDNRWLMASEHPLWLTFSPKRSNSFHTRRERRLQKCFPLNINQFFAVFVTRVCIDKVSDCFVSLVWQFNFVGKLLGPRGNSMKRLQEETGVKMSILGKGSMRDKSKVRHIDLCWNSVVWHSQKTAFTETNSLHCVWNRDE